jgi:hypothetical protein
MRKCQETLIALFTDIRLPGKFDGWDIAEHCRNGDPKLPVVYATAALIRNRGRSLAAGTSASPSVWRAWSKPFASCRRVGRRRLRGRVCRWAGLQQKKTPVETAGVFFCADRG